MGFGFSPWTIILGVLLLVMLRCSQSSIARKIAIKQWKEDRDTYDQQQQGLDNHQWIQSKHDDDNYQNGMHANHFNDMLHNSQQHVMDDHLSMAEHDDNGRKEKLEKHLHAHSSSQMDHMDPSVNIFFTTNDLKVGKTIPVYFSHKDPSTSPHLLPREEANSIPFSLAQLSYVLEFFSFSKDSPQAKAMEYTLKQCDLAPIKGESKFCATSLESMLDFARAILGLDTHLKVLTTTHLTKPTILLQNYTILEVPKEIFASKMIACHTMPYPYVVFYCHSQETENRLFEISLGGDNGERVQAAAVCHMDTSQWDSSHVSFRVLKIKPGTSPVCHFFPTDNLVWVPLSAQI